MTDEEKKDAPTESEAQLEELSPTDETELRDEPTSPGKKISGAPKPEVRSDHTGLTLPPQTRHVQVIANTVIDAVAIAALTTLSIVGSLDVTMAASLIAVIAGAWIGNQLRGGSPTAPGAGTASMVLGLLQGAASLFRRKNGG